MEEPDGQRPDETQQGTQKAQEAESGNRTAELCVLKASNGNKDRAIYKAREIIFAIEL